MGANIIYCKQVCRLSICNFGSVNVTKCVV